MHMLLLKHVTIVKDLKIKLDQITCHCIRLMGARAFSKWGIDFVGPIDPPAYRTQA